MKRNSRLKGIALLLTATLLTGGCGGEAAPESTAPAAAVKAVSPEIGTLTVSNQFVGTVSPQQQVSVIPLVSGVIDALYADVGDEVSAGQVLFHIEDDAAKLQAESAAASRKSAEASAKMQLGSAQVMNNISMESNIRSIEYQIDMAKDQYNSAIDGVQEAEDAKDDLKKAEREINDSIHGLQGSQKEMEGTISQAKKYISFDAITQEYKFKEVYGFNKSPDEYNWEDVDSVKDAGTGWLMRPGKSDEGGGPAESVQAGNSENGSGGPESGAAESGAAESGTAESDTTESGASESNTTESDAAESDTKESSTAESDTTESKSPESDADEGGGSGTAESTEETFAGTDNTAAAGGTKSSDPADNGKPAGGDKGVVDEQEEAPGTARSDMTAYRTDFAYFNVELVREESPFYLADREDDDIKAKFRTKEKAWEVYNEQQKIDSLKKKTEDMGYSPSDIMTGKADADMVEYAAKIAMLQYQASQMESSKASLESSIKSGESAESSTRKSIDFYQDNLKDAQTTYGIQNGQAYQDTADALAAQIAAADVGVKSAQLQLEYYSPSAPISGTVISKGVELYGMAQPGYAAYVISNQDAMNVTFMVSGQVRNSLMEGMPVTLEKDGETFQGTITEIGESVDAQSGGMFTVKAITEVGGDTLANGAAVKLTVDTFRSDDAVLIPYDAIHFESEKAYVFRIIDGKAVRTAVSVGLMNDDMAEITEGLAADEKVIATWSSQLEDGAAVRVIGEEGAAE